MSFPRSFFFLLILVVQSRAAYVTGCASPRMARVTASKRTKEGTVAIRVAPWLVASGNKYNKQGDRGHIPASAGLAGAKAWGTRANWVSYFGPDPSGQTVCLAMMDHPANLRHPTWWHVRTYGLFAANPFGQHDFAADKEHPHKCDFVLAKGESFTQRCLIVIQKGEPDPAKMDVAFAMSATVK